MKPANLNHTPKSYLYVFLVGIAVGCLCRLLDFFPADTLWSFSSIQTLFGFWIISNTLIVLLSTSNFCAGVSSFLYMFGMTVSFYGLKYLLGLFLPRFDGPFLTNLFLVYSLLAVFCGIAAFVLYYWNRKHCLSSMLYGLPVGALVAETVGVFAYLLEHQTFLFQLLMNLAALSVFVILFWKKAKYKYLYVISGCVTALVFYFGLYHFFL